MPKKLGNGGHSQETYDPNTGKYVEDGKENKYYDNPQENIYKASDWDPSWDFIFEEEDENEANENGVEVQEGSQFKIDYNDKEWADFNGFKTLASQPSIQEACAIVNPNYKQSPRWQNNCACCSLAYEVLRRGINVEAAMSNSVAQTKCATVMLHDSGLSSDERKQVIAVLNTCSTARQFYQKLNSMNFKIKNVAYKGTNGDYAEYTLVNGHKGNMQQAIADQILADSNGEEGARYTVAIHHHIFNAEIQNGKVLFVESQGNFTFDANQIRPQVNNSPYAHILRTDDKELTKTFDVTDSHQNKYQVSTTHNTAKTFVRIRSEK